MRHLNAGRKLNRTSAHRKALFRNQITSLLRYEKIETTLHKAKELRRFAEKTITIALRGKPNAQREVFKTVKDKEIVKKLFAEIVPMIGSRKGGYTRIIPVGSRRGDCAEMAVIELVDGRSEKNEAKSADKNRPKKEAKAKTKESKPKKENRSEELKTKETKPKKAKAKTDDKTESTAKPKKVPKKDDKDTDKKAEK